MSKGVGQKIRKLRVAKGWSLDELSSASGVNRDHLGRLERGEKNNFRYDTVESVAKALGVHPALILFGKVTAPEKHLEHPRGIGVLNTYEERIITKLRQISGDANLEGLEDFIDVFVKLSKKSSKKARKR